MVCAQSQNLYKGLDLCHIPPVNQVPFTQFSHFLPQTPNLVIVENDDRGHPHYKRAFNTQACEQLNAWIGGFQSILNKMTVNNFNWSLHALLFLHTQKVIIKQNARRGGQSDDTDESDEEVGIDIDRERE